MSALTVLLVEDEPETCKAYIDYADRLDDISIIGVTADADKAVEMIQDRLPEAIILDIELRKGGGNGLDVLRQMHELSLGIRPYVMVVTNSVSDTTIEFARHSYHVDINISKNQRGYCEKYVLDFLRPMRDIIQRNYRAGSPRESTPETPAQKRNRIIRRIHAELNNVGINPKAIGYQYLTDGILLTIEQPRQYLCNDIAKSHGKTEASVERAMQSAINKAWQVTDIDQLLAHYTARINSKKGVPTLTEFVYHYATKIGDEYSA